MAGQTYDSVPLRVERFDDEAFVTIAAVKTGTVDELVEHERNRAAAESQSDTEG